MEGVSVPVAGPSVIFPRGYLWFVPIWFAAAAGWLYLTKWPLWFRADAAAALLLALLVLVAAINSLTFRAFSADRAGVRLGLHPGSKRRGRRRRAARHLPWQQIERIRIARRPGGVRLDIILGPEASLRLRGHPASAAVSFINRILLLVIPFYYLARPTGADQPAGRPASVPGQAAGYHGRRAQARAASARSAGSGYRRVGPPTPVRIIGASGWLTSAHCGLARG